MRKKLIVCVLITLCISFWPINLFLNNSRINFLTYFLPAIFVGLSYFYPGTILAVSVVSPKLAILPLLFLVIGKKSLILIIIALVVFMLQFNKFRGVTVFVKDYEAQQLVYRKIQLYPNRLLARTFQNKPRIYLNKLVDNFFVLADPNNYFFAMHPAPVLGNNQNIFKFPFYAAPLLILGLINIKRSKHKNFIIVSFLAGLISLSILKNYDGHDFILWAPLSLIIINGIKKIF